MALKPDKIGKEVSYDAFANGNVLYGKKKGNLPAMGWNSWNAFGSGNTEKLTKEMAECLCKLGLKDLGYVYVVLDDGCYKPERVDGKLSNEEIKFPGGFRALADHLHKAGLKFGMYNDVGTNLCAGAAVGTCGHEREDARSYIDWDVDFLKVDNCYYPYDNATFSNPENARFVYAPNIKSIKIGSKKYSAVKDAQITGKVASVNNSEFVTGLGTFDGTGPRYSPVGSRSSELVFTVNSKKEEEAELLVEYATGKREGVGEWLQVAVENERIFDALLPATDSEKDFTWSKAIKIRLQKGENHIRLMNHRRQENTLNSYAKLLKYLKEAAPEKDILYSACEWGKTQPQNWAGKVCDSWRILNDITFCVGNDGDPGHGDWAGDYTCSVTSQYNKAVIMEEFSGLDKGWNDPDMLMIGMNGLNLTQNRTHMSMWCMMNAPLMLGLDLRRVKKGDDLYNIIANRELISINQDPLGIQAKRLYCSLAMNRPVHSYVRDINRVDILAKPLADGRFAISFINVSEKTQKGDFAITDEQIRKAFKGRIAESKRFEVLDVWTKETKNNRDGIFRVRKLAPCESVTWIVTPQA